MDSLLMTAAETAVRKHHLQENSACKCKNAVKQVPECSFMHGLQAGPLPIGHSAACMSV